MTEPGRPERDNVAVVIPALNESLRIRETVIGALAHCPNVIVIDDGSDDGTAECIADLPATVLRHPRRMGKGASLRDGFREALRRGYAGVLTLDGDGQHDPADLPRLLASAQRHPGCIVIGARLRKRASAPVYRRLANEFGDWGIGWGCGYRIADSQSGQRYYPAAVCALDEVPGEDFVFEAQILISAARRLGTGVVSVPIESRYQQANDEVRFRKSHFRPLRDLYRITSHVVAQVWGHGDVMEEYRRTRAAAPVIDDPSGEFAGARERDLPAEPR
ncbi:glycosyltransferase family 2 protein [Lysobacter sp. Root983]|uniref:glycosyltransferase family 2 protein n=1 Tax=Lysobacter sp. Root983 TaxID=1736613 RepID=UPI000709725B|nr:glycosyltransferase family 2 protein [Lysobacter sp. Root983]KRD76924.1 dolichyl-phosphate mannose synthase [Lysobacter sp. Root983]